MKHLRLAVAAVVVAGLTACDSTPVDPGASGTALGDGVDVSASVLGAVPVLNEADGHLYDAIAPDGGINWTDARAAAEAMSFGECQAYLASITSTEENDFILTSFPSAVPAVGGVGYWIGGYQPPATTPADAGWLWVSGEAFGFTDWSDGQPDDGGVLMDEDAIHFTAVSDGGFGGIPGWADRNQTETTPGYVVEFEGECSPDEVVEVMLRLKQGEGARNINLKSRGKIAASVLSVADSGAGDGFDATTIDPSTVTLGDGTDPDAPVASNKHGKYQVSWPDLNEDGLADALFHFETQALIGAGLTAETTELVLRGETTDGVAFTGSDAVNVK